ncbi:hypothetical protein DENIS_4673 [Desulfonema ishimotonii]|uniref:DUF4276 domain-containing protein n=1 Tax=Desulfonema ishimotonii TaxID=45657 RepID=A0A401G3I4_9BACT|nr:hypothetical protein [Desulfonema ishimotonii]GBC63675.1 hypothetical protein DENIS_4673 [Desulfonema ishimotonii]
MIIGTIVEGTTDRIVLKSVLNALIPGNHRFLALQPVSPPERSNGWKGVRSWCRQIAEESSLEEILSGETGDPIDLLVIHVDADIADKRGLQDGNEKKTPEVMRPCPPISATIRQIEHVIRKWLNRDELPEKVVLAIPSQDTENWTFAALFPEDPICIRDDYECIKNGHHRPVHKLSLRKYGKYFKRKGNEIKKSKRAYDKLAPVIAENWETVCNICSLAQQFTQDIELLVTGKK